MEIKVNDVILKISDNYKVRKYRHDNLNIVSVTLNHMPALDFEQMSKVEFDGKYYYLLDSESKEISQNPMLYNYTVNLSDPTLYLKNIILPNKAVTRRLNNPKTTIELMEEYIEVYAPHLVIHNDLRLALQGKIAREGVWTKPTLYKVFNDLVTSHLSAVVRMIDYNTITFKSLVEAGQPITNYSRVNKKSDFENYANKMNVELKDARFEDKVIQEMLDFKTPNGPNVKDNDFYLETSFPIDEIYNLQISVAPYLITNRLPLSALRKRFSIYNHIVRKEVYDTYLPSTNSGLVIGQNFRRNAIYFEKGKNIISGWNYKDNDWIPLINVDTQTYNNIFKQYMTITSTQGYDLKSAVVFISYKPIIKDVTIDIVKESMEGNRTVLTAQDSDSIDIDIFGKRQRSLLNGIAEDVVYIYGQGKPPELMDYLGNNYVSELQINRSSTGDDWMATAQKNYNEYNLSDAIKSEKRFTERAGINEVVVSNNTTQYNLEFTGEYKPNTLGHEIKIFNYFKQTINGVGPNLRDFFMLFKSQNIWIVKKMLNFTVDNAWIFNFKMKDNFSAGTGFEIENFNGANEVGASIGNQLEVEYVDGNGEFEKMDMIMCRGNYFGEGFNALNGRDYIASKAKPRAVFGPTGGVDTDVIFNITNIPRYKDDREILSETVQFNFLNNDEFIFYEEAFRLGSMNGNQEGVRFELYVNYDRPEYKYNAYGTKIGTRKYNPFVIGSNSIKIEGLGVFYGWIVYNGITNQPLFSYNGSRSVLYLVNKDRPLNIVDPVMFSFDINDTIYYNIFESKNTHLRYIFDINDNTEYKSFKTTTMQKQFIFNINDNTQYKINITDDIQKLYEFNINEDMQYKINTTDDIQKLYNFDINEDVNYDIYKSVGFNKQYNFDINEDMLYTVSINSGIQKEYIFNINDDTYYITI